MRHKIVMLSEKVPDVNPQLRFRACEEYGTSVEIGIYDQVLQILVPGYSGGSKERNIYIYLTEEETNND